MYSEKHQDNRASHKMSDTFFIVNDTYEKIIENGSYNESDCKNSFEQSVHSRT